MKSIKVTKLCCKLGIDYAFKQREKNMIKWRSVEKMETFDGNTEIILWENKFQTISFAVSRCVCIQTHTYIYIYIYVYICLIK